MILEWAMLVIALALWSWLAFNLWLHASYLGRLLGKKAAAMITGNKLWGDGS